MRRYRRRNKQKRIIIISSICLLFMITAGYAAFSTNLNITAKGNIKNLKEEVDSQIPTDEMLFWGQADNEENTLTILKDKSENNNNGTLHGFDNTNSSGYTDEGLIFDGIDDYVDIGLANYDFENSISYVVYVKINDIVSGEIDIINNFQNAGSGLAITDGVLRFSIYDIQYKMAIYNNTIDKTKYYTIIGTYDGQNVKLYIDGYLVDQTTASFVAKSEVGISLGANPTPEAYGPYLGFINMNLKEAILYDRALTEDEVKTITEGFNKKYN